MKRRDGALNPARQKALPPVKLVCGAPLPGGGCCARPVATPGPCYEHGGPRPAQETGLPAGYRIHKAFAQEDRQLELERYVARIMVEYALNETADLRQVVLSGIAYVRLLFDGATMEAKELEMLSRVVDRHLRNLRATPAAQAAGKTPCTGEGGLPAPGMMPAAILERVRLALTPGQVAAMVGGRGLDQQAPGRTTPACGLDAAVEVVEVVEEDPLFPAPRRAVADPFAVIGAGDDDLETPPDPFED